MPTFAVPNNPNTLLGCITNIVTEVFNKSLRVKAAMEDAQAEHESIVARQKMEGESRARADDAAQEQIDREQDVHAAVMDADGFASPLEESPQTLRAEDEPKPKRMRKRYVRRGSVWMRTKQIKHFRVGEPVWVNEGSEFVQIGVVNKNSKPPVCFMED
jgi:hypothetical protein